MRLFPPGKTFATSLLTARGGLTPGAEGRLEPDSPPSRAPARTTENLMAAELPRDVLPIADRPVAASTALDAKDPGVS